MKKKKIIFIILSLIIVISLFFTFMLINSDRLNRLTLQENKWIEEHKHDIIDIAIINDIPIISYEGTGIIYSFLDDLKENFSFNFNYSSYKIDEKIDLNYKMQIKDEVKSNDLIIYQDNLIYVNVKNIDKKKEIVISTADYSTADQIPELVEQNNVTDEVLNENIEISNDRVGIVKSDKELLDKYFGNSMNFVVYDTYSELKQSVIENKVDAVIILKSLFMKEIIDNNYTIEHQYNDLTKYYVLTIKGDKDFLSILKKQYNKWSRENFEQEYYSNLLLNYYKFKKINDITQKELNSKSYVYGFIDYGVYNYISRNEISGLNGIVLKEFNKFSGVPIKYIRYNSLNKLITEFNNQNVDFTMNIISPSKLTAKNRLTSKTFDKKLIVISGISNNKTIDSIKSLQNQEVLTIKDSYIEDMLLNVDSKVVLYNDVKDLTKEFNNNSIAIVDLENYNYYKTSAFKNCKINYLFEETDEYNYVVNDISANKTFFDLFDFYLNYVSINKLVNKNYGEVSYKNVDVIIILVVIIIILCSYVVIDFTNHLHVMIKQINKKKNIRLSKNDKIKYIDQLTSLKNRAYLNSKIEVWDEAEIYPKAIVIIDLNNVSYINDNYGREEGDKVITEAANILIQNQLENSEIIRSDGNEFLIYLVGYNDKQIASYLRKLSKELKGLSHGFGSASGYSIIEDDLKTIDDAVNEATLDMKNNKEDIDY